MTATQTSKTAADKAAPTRRKRATPPKPIQDMTSQEVAGMVQDLNAKQGQADLEARILLDEESAALEAQVAANVKAQRAADRKARAAARKSAGETKPARTPEEQEAIPAKAVKVKKERRNETSHPDGALAVESTGCPTCKARKGAKCIRHDGERTNHVHSARMTKAGV